MIEEIKDIIKNNNITYLVTSGSYPKISPEIYFYQSGKFAITTSVVFSEKLNNIRDNPKVTLYISDGNRELVINGRAELSDDDLEKSWLKYQDEWFSHDKFAARLFETRDFLPQFWKRLLIIIIPERITLNPKNENYTVNLEVL